MAAIRLQSVSLAMARWARALLYEVMNMASLWKLPVIYVCENNLYNEYTHNSRDHRRRADRAARAFGIPTEEVDGQDVRPVYAAAHAHGRTRARAGEGPAFLLCNTYRYYGHHVGDIQRTYYRSKEEEEHSGRRSAIPITLLGRVADSRKNC